MPFTLLGSPNSGSRTKRKLVQWSSPYRYVFLEKIVPWLSYFKVTNIKIILIKKMKNGQNWTFLHVFYMYHCSQAALMYNPDVTEVHVYVTQPNSKSPVQGEVEKFVKEFAQGGCPTYTREILSPFRIMDRSLRYTPIYFLVHTITQQVKGFGDSSIIMIKCNKFWPIYFFYLFKIS